MKNKIYSLVILLLILLISGCTHHVQEVILSSPPGGDIYWGKSESEMVKTGRQTDSVRSMAGEEWESWCYQVIREGYLPSEIACRPAGEVYRTIQFNLTRINTFITSEPSNAEIYWGPSKDHLTKTGYLTPLTENRMHIDARYKDWYFQVKKEGFKDSEIIFLPRAKEDREIHFVLDPAE